VPFVDVRVLIQDRIIGMRTPGVPIRSAAAPHDNYHACTLGGVRQILDRCGQLQPERCTQLARRFRYVGEVPADNGELYRRELSLVIEPIHKLGKEAHELAQPGRFPLEHALRGFEQKVVVRQWRRWAGGEERGAEPEILAGE
jgi:hypothetical protein